MTAISLFSDVLGGPLLFWVLEQCEIIRIKTSIWLSIKSQLFNTVQPWANYCPFSSSRASPSPPGSLLWPLRPFSLPFSSAQADLGGGSWVGRECTLVRVEAGPLSCLWPCVTTGSFLLHFALQFLHLKLGRIIPVLPNPRSFLASTR